MQEMAINMAGSNLPFSGYKTFSTEHAKSMGVVSAEKGEKPGNSFGFAKDINKFMNRVAGERKSGPTVNVFWLKDNPHKDTLFLQIPLIPDRSQKEIPTLAVVLQTDPKTREIIVQLLTAPGTTQEALKEYITALLDPSGSKIDPEKINANKIASLPDSGNKLALAATNRGKIPFSDKLAEPFKSQINIVTLDHQREEVSELGGGHRLLLH
jgi:hypothetical protein